MQKIIMFIPTLQYGGAERVTSILSKEFCDKYEVYIITEATEVKNEYVLDERIHRIKIKSKYKIFSIFEIRKIVKKIMPKLCLVIFAPQYSYLFFALLGLNLKQIVSERNDPIRFSGSKINKILYQYLLKKADGIIFQTYDAMKYYYKKPSNKCVIIPNPIVIKNLPNKYEGTREKKIVNVGRLHEQKNQKLLIEAFVKAHKIVPDYKLEIYGQGHLEKELLNLIKKLKAEEYISLMGTSNSLLKEIVNSSLFILSSNYEGMPNALIEAMCLGIPSISTDCPCGGPRELINNYENGLLVPIKNIDKMTDAIIEILTNRELSNKISENSFDLRNRLDSKKIAEQWLIFLDKILNKK